MSSLKIPEGNFKAYIFDCDGTIADSMPLHLIAWNEELAEWGCEFSEELHMEWAGMPTQVIIERLNKKYGLKMPPMKVAESREQRYLKMLSKIQGIPSVVEQIHLHHGKKLFAVASGSHRAAVTQTLSTLGLLGKFDTIVTAEDYSQGKPHPEVFLIAAQRLGVEPQDCLVFEDADLGVQAAEAAGMKWVRVPIISAATYRGR